jgi:hypothetical protein
MQFLLESIYLKVNKITASAMRGTCLPAKTVGIEINPFIHPIALQPKSGLGLLV